MEQTEDIFRKEYRELSNDEKNQLDAIKSKAYELWQIYNTVEDSREKSLARTHLEESVMWVVKKITG